MSNLAYFCPMNFRKLVHIRGKLLDMAADGFLERRKDGIFV
jgi:hypothetical protein